MTRILVTGAPGLLGQSLLKCLKKSYDVMGISKSGRLGSEACDLADETQVKDAWKRMRPQAVIHAAAYSDVDGCEKDPLAAHEANAKATRHVVSACEVGQIPLVYVSTDYVFDGRKKSAYTEMDRTGPVNVYGMTKLEGEFYVLREALFPRAIVRTSWLFGSGSSNNFVQAILGRLQKESRVAVLNDQVDSPTFVDDLSMALERIAERLMGEKKNPPEPSKAQIYHVCNAGATTRYEMTLKMAELMGLKKVQIEKMDASLIKNRLALRPAYAVMSTEHYKKTFGTKLRHWEEALKDYLSQQALCVS